MNNPAKLLFHGISGKIRLVIGICFLITLLVLGIFIYSQVEENLVSIYEANLKNTTRLIYQMTELYIYSSIKSYLTGIAEKTKSLAGYYYDKAARGEISAEEARALFKSIILDPGYGKIGDTGYIAALDSHGLATIHPRPGVEGANLRHIPVMQKAIEMKNGYFLYLWKDPEDAVQEEQAAAITYFEAWDMIIWVTSCKLDSSLLIDMDELEHKIADLKISRNGYPFIMDSKGTLIIHPDKKMQGKNIYDNTDAANKQYIAEICRSVLKDSAAVKKPDKEADAEKIEQPGNGADPGQPDSSIQGTVITAAYAKDINPQIVFYAGESPGDKNPANKIAAYYYYKDRDWIIFSSAPVAEMYGNSNSIKQGSIWIVVVAFFIYHSVIAFFIYLIMRPVAKIKKIVSLISRGDLNQRMDIASNDEIGEISEQFNTLVDGFRKVLNRIKKSAASLFDSVHDLSASSRQISSTSNEQAAAVKEIVSTMEDSDTLARSVAEKINGVAEIAGRMKETIAGGFAITKNSLAKMDEIRQSNTETITGIQALSGRIGSIWEIVNIINNIADQTKIIAFNAELEASAAGEAGRNFQIVATEIRRLADSTVISTNEIKKKIHEIQNSSDNLIIASEEGTSRIKEGWKLSRELQEVFDAIRNSSEISAASADQIALSINQQAAAFEQILLTLKQISEGIDNLVDSTKTTSRESEKLKEMADGLNAVVDEYIHTDREANL